MGCSTSLHRVELLLSKGYLYRPEPKVASVEGDNYGTFSDKNKWHWLAETYAYCKGDFYLAPPLRIEATPLAG